MTKMKKKGTRFVITAEPFIPSRLSILELDIWKASSETKGPFVHKLCQRYQILWENANLEP